MCWNIIKVKCSRKRPWPRGGLILGTSRVSVPWRDPWQMTGGAFIRRLSTLKRFLRAAASDLKSINTRYTEKHTSWGWEDAATRVSRARSLTFLYNHTQETYEATNDGILRGFKIHPWLWVWLGFSSPWLKAEVTCLSVYVFVFFTYKHRQVTLID